MIIKRTLFRRVSKPLKFLGQKSSMAAAVAEAEATVPILNLEMGSFYIPKNNPLKPRGEDAHFVFPEKQAAGVADGVGGWAAKGIDSGKYARGLMRNCVVTAVASGGAFLNPKRVLTKAHSRTTAAGSSTACLISFDGVYLQAANLGDSGFAIFRRRQFVYQSPVQRRGFNCPFQLGTGEGCESPAAAWSGKIMLKPGDIVVVGTDGLFDNVFAEEMYETLGAEEAAATVEELAAILAELAFNNSMDKFKDSPFAAEAREAGRSHHGGKADDITVIVGRVTVASSSS